MNRETYTERFLAVLRAEVIPELMRQQAWAEGDYTLAVDYSDLRCPVMVVSMATGTVHRIPMRLAPEGLEN